MRHWPTLTMSPHIVLPDEEIEDPFGIAYMPHGVSRSVFQSAIHIIYFSWNCYSHFSDQFEIENIFVSSWCLTLLWLSIYVSSLNLNNENGGASQAVPVTFSSSHSVPSSSSLCYVLLLSREESERRRRWLRGRKNTMFSLSSSTILSRLLWPPKADWIWRFETESGALWRSISGNEMTPPLLSRSRSFPIHSRQKRAEIRCLDLAHSHPIPLLFSSNSTSFKTKVLTTRDKDSLRNPQRFFSLFWPLINTVVSSSLLPSLRLGTNFTPKRRYVGWLAVRFFATTTPKSLGVDSPLNLIYSFYPPPISFPLTE